MRAQKKIIGKIGSSRTFVKHFINDTAARLLDNLYRLLKDFYSKREAEKVRRPHPDRQPSSLL
jgi:hypothetical protein